MFYDYYHCFIFNWCWMLTFWHKIKCLYLYHAWLHNGKCLQAYILNILYIMCTLDHPPPPAKNKVKRDFLHHCICHRCISAKMLHSGDNSFFSCQFSSYSTIYNDFKIYFPLTCKIYIIWITEYEKYLITNVQWSVLCIYLDSSIYFPRYMYM